MCYICMYVRRIDYEQIRSRINQLLIDSATYLLTINSPTLKSIAMSLHYDIMHVNRVHVLMQLGSRSTVVLIASPLSTAGCFHYGRQGVSARWWRGASMLDYGARCAGTKQK